MYLTAKLTFKQDYRNGSRKNVATREEAELLKVNTTIIQVQNWSIVAKCGSQKENATDDT